MSHEISVVSAGVDEFFSGAHGTCRSFGDEILKNKKFDISKSKEGYYGNGVYFWSYIDNPELATELGILWWEFQKKKDKYLDAENKDRCVLLAKIKNPGEDKTIDLTGQRLREQVYGICKKRLESDKNRLNGAAPIKSIDQDMINIIYQMLVYSEEKKRNCTIWVVRATVSTPPAIKQSEFIGQSLAREISKTADAYLVRGKSEELIQDIADGLKI